MTIAPFPWPRWVAHRGAGKLAPENTLAAFRHGASFGYTAFECDVKLSADDVPFLLHDATLDRTTNARGIAGERAWAELSRLDGGAWHGPAWAGEPLPSLDAIGAWCRANGHALNIEIKPTPGHEHRTGEQVARAAAQAWRGQVLAPLLSSFAPAALAAARAAAPDLPRALLLEQLHDGWFEQAQGLGCVAVVANHQAMTPDAVRRLHAGRLWALCYTVNEPARAQALLDFGLDALITDAVDRLPPRG